MAMELEDTHATNDLPEDYVPSECDVIVGWARQNYHHGGNQKLRDVVHSHVPKYLAAKSKTEKGILITAIIAKLRQESPTGVGLVRQNSKTMRWSYIGLDKAKDKIGHALRKASQEYQKKQGMPRYASSSSLHSIHRMRHSASCNSLAVDSNTSTTRSSHSSDEDDEERRGDGTPYRAHYDTTGMSRHGGYYAHPGGYPMPQYPYPTPPHNLGYQHHPQVQHHAHSQHHPPAVAAAATYPPYAPHSQMHYAPHHPSHQQGYPMASAEQSQHHPPQTSGHSNQHQHHQHQHGQRHHSFSHYPSTHHHVHSSGPYSEAIASSTNASVILPPIPPAPKQQVHPLSPPVLSAEVHSSHNLHHQEHHQHVVVVGGGGGGHPEAEHPHESHYNTSHNPHAHAHHHHHQEQPHHHEHHEHEQQQYHHPHEHHQVQQQQQQHSSMDPPPPPPQQYHAVSPPPPHHHPHHHHPHHDYEEQRDHVEPTTGASHGYAPRYEAPSTTAGFVTY